MLEQHYNEINKKIPYKSLYKIYTIKNTRYCVYNNDDFWFYKAYLKDNPNSELIKFFMKEFNKISPCEMYLKPKAFYKNLVQYNCLYPISDKNIVEISDFNKNFWCRYDDKSNPKYKEMSSKEINELFDIEFYNFNLKDITKKFNVSISYIRALLDFYKPLEYNNVKIRYFY